MNKKLEQKFSSWFIADVQEECRGTIKKAEETVKKAINGDPEGTIGLAQYAYASRNKEAYLYWIKKAAYELDSTEAGCIMAGHAQFDSDYDLFHRSMNFLMKKKYPHINTLVLERCERDNTALAIKYLEFAYNNDDIEYRSLISTRLSHLYSGIRNPKFRNKEKYEFWLKESRRYRPKAEDFFDDEEMIKERYNEFCMGEYVLF